MKNTTLHILAAPLLCLAALPGCVSITSGPQHITHNNATPTSGGFNMISLEEEIALGHREFAKVKAQKPRTGDPSKQQAAQRVLNRLIAANNLHNDYPWEIVVFADNTPNAFALPGGKIGIHDGIFKYTKNDDGLAAVIGHEMVHITARHATQRVSRQIAAGMVGVGLASVIAGGDPNMARGLNEVFGIGANVGVVLPYSREAEFEADRIGVLYMARAGYDPEESLKVWRRFEKAGSHHPPQWLSSHPHTTERIRQIEMNMPRYKSIYNNTRS